MLSFATHFYFIFLNMSKAISVSAGPIFMIFFSPNGRYLREFSQSGPVFPIPQGTLLWQPILWQNCGKINYPSCTYRSVVPKQNGISLLQ